MMHVVPPYPFTGCSPFEAAYAFWKTLVIAATARPLHNKATGRAPSGHAGVN